MGVQERAPPAHAVGVSTDDSRPREVSTEWHWSGLGGFSQLTSN